jgi:hypothetical protein
MNEKVKVSYSLPDTTPEEVRARTRRWLEDQEWPQNVSVPALGMGDRIVVYTPRRDAYSRSGCIVNAVLGVLTLGLWAVVAGAYYLLDMLAEPPPALYFEAWDAGMGETRLTVSVSRMQPERPAVYLAELPDFVIEELGGQELPTW